jgi:4-hydroxythreonine-4-phosphate dehydrogenase
MISNSLRVALVTDHIPINKVSKTLSIELIELKINQVLSSLINDFGILKPRIAVLGLNPHAGDNGVIGKEDDRIVKPAIEKTKRINEEVNGPFAADSFFTSKNLKEYDAILAIYHDQGLIPFKTLSFGNGVNFTAGLSLVRTSPDHGTAFDIAGLGIAKTNSYKTALLEAIKIFKTRNHLNYKI